MTMTSTHPPRGVALFAALALMSLVALLVAGATASIRASQRASRLAQTDVSLTTAADYALANVLADARALGLADAPLGTPIVFDVPIPGAPDVQVSVAVTRLPAGVLWMVADALAGVDRGRRRVNLVAGFPSLGGRIAGPVTARGDVEIRSHVAFLPDSSTDPECAAFIGRPVAIAPSAVVSGIDSSAVSVSASALDSATYYLTGRQLDALREAGRFVHVLGDTTISTGSFDGILMVDGVLTITGPFSMSGLIVARGAIDATTENSLSLVGAVMSFAPTGSNGPAIKFSGVTIRYSQCAVDRALRRAVIPRRVVQRSWIELFSP